MSKFILRHSLETDNKKLIELEKACPQGSRLSITTERKDFFFRSRLYGNHHTLIALDGEIIIGVIAATMKIIQIDGNEIPIVFMYDLKIHPDYRKSLGAIIMVKAWKRTEEWAREQGAHILYGYVKSDNQIMKSFFEKRKYSVGGEMVVCSRPSYKKRRISITPKEISCNSKTILKQFSAEYSSKNLLPLVFRTSVFTDKMKSSGLFSYFQIEKDGSSASAGLLRQSEMVFTHVRSVPFYYKAARIVAQPLSRIFPLPNIPGDGSIIKYYHAFNHTASGPEGIILWKELMKFLNNLTLSAGCSLLTSAFDQKDRFFPLYRSGSINIIRYILGFKALKEGIPGEFSPFYPDIRDMD